MAFSIEHLKRGMLSLSFADAFRGATESLERTTQGVTEALKQCDSVNIHSDKALRDSSSGRCSITASSQECRPDKSSPSPCRDSSISTSSSSSLTRFLDGSAIEFQPSAPPLHEIRNVKGKGLGIFATRDIPIGTRIICEAPLLKIESNDAFLVWEQYEKLSKLEQHQYDQLHRFRRQNLDFEREALLHLMPENLTKDDRQKLIAKQVATMERFSANNFLIENDNHAVFLTSSRLNHSCEPNVFQCFNPVLKMKTVHAMRHIEQGEELSTNYLGRECHYLSRVARWELFRTQWGFTCQCAACVDRTNQSDLRHQLLENLVARLFEFSEGKEDPNDSLLPNSTASALEIAHYVLRLVLQQKMFGPELILAHRLIATFALQLGDYAQAWEFANNEREVERNIMGTELDDLKLVGAGSEVWMSHVRGAMHDAGYSPKELSSKKAKSTATKAQKKAAANKRKVRKREAAET